MYCCNQSTSWIFEKSDAVMAIGKKESQLIYGECFLPQKNEGQFVFGHTEDGYHGYVRHSDVSEKKSKPTHKVSVLQSHLYEDADFKTRPLMPVSMLSSLSLTNVRKNGFIRTEEGVWIFEKHVSPLDRYDQDFVSTAKKFLGVPYLYGGMSAAGIDCSGLIRISLKMAGIDCPRDCDQQEMALQKDIPHNSSLRKGDLIYLSGHVVMMLDENYCLNATARHMSTVIEHIDDILNFYTEIKAIKRLI